MNTPYRFVLEVRAPSGEVVHHQTISPDWALALEAARLNGLRHGHEWLSNDQLRAELEPVWSDPEAPSSLRGFRVEAGDVGRRWSTDFTMAGFFSDAARAAVAACVAAGRLTSQDRALFEVAAYPTDIINVPPSLLVTSVDRPPHLVLHRRDFRQWRNEASTKSAGSSTDIDVLLPADVLQEVHALTIEAGDCETGGVLLGHVCRDETSGEIGLEITAQVRARHTVGDATKLTFTSDTWTDVRSVAALRKAGELLVGYWHSHPAQAWCKACPVESQRACHLSKGFLSADDRDVQRVVFPAAYTQALVVTNSINGLDTTLFGWRDGVLQPRGYWCSPAVPPQTGEVFDETTVAAGR
jgi:hypothetical protein